MKRGEIWTASGGAEYSGKPRPAIIVQEDELGEAVSSVTVCYCTSNSEGPPLVRPEVAPTEANGLRVHSRMMADKITTIAKSKLGNRIGRLADEDMGRLNRAMMVFLGLASTRAS